MKRGKYKKYGHIMTIFEKLTTLENEATHFGFKWDNAEQIMAQIQSECSEISVHFKHLTNNAGDEQLQEEIGDLLHAAFSLCVFCQFDPKDTLTKSVSKFERRFNVVKQLAYEQGLTTLEGHSFEELMMFWDQAKEITG